MQKMKSAFFSNGVDWMPGGHVIDVVYGEEYRQRIADQTELYPHIITDQNFEEHGDFLTGVDVVFSTWGMFPLNNDQLSRLEQLKAVFYAAGETGYFREPLLEREIAVCSATAANSIPVAEFAYAQVLLAGAGYFLNTRQCVDEQSTRFGNNFRGHGNYGGQVAIIGNGTISQRLQELLSAHQQNVVVVPARKERRTVSLEEAFAGSFAVVNLLPDRDDNAGVLNGALFERMKENAVFINVGRGRQVNEDDLIQVFRERPDLTALLDVQYPEPPQDGSELYALPNVQLTGHIAGATGTDLMRLGEYMVDEFERFRQGVPLRHQVRIESL